MVRYKPQDHNSLLLHVVQSEQIIPCVMLKTVWSV
jgi:hypothetical protein